MPLFHFLLLFIFFAPLSGRDKTICLNMIVKNESEVIKRCLESAKPLIDYWVIVDTGSTDNTQEIIRGILADIPGELHERAWVNFEHNRNEALELAQDKADYLLFLDADDLYTTERDFYYPEVMDKDFYYITVQHGNTKHNRPELIKTGLHWKWEDVLHEAIGPLAGKTYAVLERITYQVSGGGARSQDPEKFKKDIEVLKKALEEKPNHNRYVFYLAQSYKDAGEKEEAIKIYERRVKMRGWDQEVFWSLVQIAGLKEDLHKEEEEVIAAYKRAYRFRPHRLEPLYYAMLYHWKKGNFAEGFRIGKMGLPLSKTTDTLFVNQDVYDFNFLLYYSLCAYHEGYMREAYLASKCILEKENIPDYIRDCVQKNIQIYIPLMVDF